MTLKIPSPYYEYDGILFTWLGYYHLTELIKRQIILGGPDLIKEAFKSTLAGLEESKQHCTTAYHWPCGRNFQF